MHILEDSVEILDPNFYYLLSANVRTTSDYAYSNIHLKLSIISPNGEKTAYKVPVTLAEKSGKWKGSGIGGVITLQSPILNRKLFNQKGIYHLVLEQNMRLENLPNVTSAGIRIEQQEEIF